VVHMARRSPRSRLMALIRPTQTFAPAAGEALDPALLAERLRHGAPSERRDAARELALLPDSSPLLVEQLEEENEPVVREALMLALARRADETAVRALLDCLRSEDAALRSDAIELLKTAGSAHPYPVDRKSTRLNSSHVKI